MLPLALGIGAAAAQPNAPVPASGEAFPAQQAEVPDANGLFSFDIPAQPLDDALNQYAGITGRPAVFRSALVAGRTASTVRGMHSPESALRMMLAGTGLEADRVVAGGVQAFVLRPADAGAPMPPSSHTAPAAVAAGAGRSDYDARVQQAIWETLCVNPLTAPGDYRALLRFRVDESGKLGQAQLLTSTGQPRRDALLLQLMQRVRVGAPPPRDLAQPLTLLLLPRGAVTGRDCPARPASPATGP